MTRDEILAERVDREIALLPKTQQCWFHDSETVTLDPQATRNRAIPAGYVVDRGEYVGCQLCADERHAQRERFLLECGVPRRLLHAKFSNFRCDTPADTEALSAAREFVKVRRGFLFAVGDIGRGKSHLAVAALRQFERPRFARQAELLKMLRDTYSDREAPDPIQICAEAEVLCLDEFGVSPSGKDEPGLLYEIVQRRFESLAPTIITSNLSPPQIAEALGARLADRLREALFRVVVLTGPSRRSQGDYFAVKPVAPAPANPLSQCL
jgi:DNA replication protein DnaC